MRFGFSDDQRLLQATVREMLQKECTPALVRELWSSDTGRSPQLWAALAEMGVLGVLVPEDLGGLGMGDLDLVLLLEESGRVALPGPLVETAAVAAPLLRDTEVAAAWLPAMAAGEAVVAVGLASSSFVADAHAADLLLLQDGEELRVVAGGDVDVEPVRSVDGARRLFRVRWDRTSGTVVGGPDVVAAAYDRGALGTAAQLLGLAQHLLDTTVAYATVREQFGVPIGSFQAVKHHLANALKDVEFARPLVYRAAGTLDPVHVSMAKAAASDAASVTARTALQVHGAIGYTFEYDLQLWMKRVWALAAAWGDGPWHRRRVAAHLIERG